MSESASCWINGDGQSIVLRKKQNCLNPLLQICLTEFGITLSQFFADGNWVELTDEQVAFFDEWTSLTADEKELVRQIVCKFKEDH